MPILLHKQKNVSNFVRQTRYNPHMRRYISTILLLFVTVLAAAPWQYAYASNAVEIRADRQPAVYVEKGSLELSATDSDPVKFEIFSITGQLIKSVTVKNSTVKVDLPKGFYIIKCEAWTKRVMIK